MKNFVWVVVFLGFVFIGLCALQFFNVPSQANIFIGLGALSGVLTNWTLKRIRREP
jgi:hypothetical protein